MASAPWMIDGPTCFSFSGGRTSAFMLHRLLEEHGAVPEGVQVCFANTGKERPETLDFVQQVSLRWGVPVVWLEWRPPDAFEVVDFTSAARGGEPFEALIKLKQFTPNPRARFCTQHLKIYTIHRYLKSLGWTEWDSFIGIRYDEPRRWKIEGPDPRARFDNRRLPLKHDLVTEQDVLRFWEAQPFDLHLSPHEGNCDLCYLKGPRKLRRIIQDRPDLVAWWERMERETVPFRVDRPGYAAMLRNRNAQPLLPFADLGDDEDTIPCMCTD